MTLSDQLDLYANALTARLLRRFMRWRVRNHDNDNSWGRAA